MLTKHRFTVDECYRMAETGIIKPDARVELLEGGIIDMMPIATRSSPRMAKPAFPKPGS